MNEASDRTTPPPLTGPWGAALDQLRQWDSQWADTSTKVSTNPWSSAVLPLKTVELVCVGLNAVGQNPNPDGMRRHIRAALAAGASRDEILLVLKCASVMSIHSAVLGASVLNKEAFIGDLDDAAAERAQRLKNPESTPACDQLRAAGQWDDAWNPVLELAPVWFDAFMATGLDIYKSGVLPAKDVELLLIALNAAANQMYEPGLHRHIKAALRQRATIAEIVEVLKLCVIQGVHAFNFGVPILAEELARKG